jgi:Zn-dependent protease
MEKATVFIVVIIGWIFSLCLHEFSHALVAYYGGDTSVKEKGYLTFNPLKYTHPMLSIVMPLIFLALGGIGLPGGAVYIETWRIRDRRWLSAVSLAGPLSNLILAIFLGLLLQIDSIAFGPIGVGLAFLALLQVSAVVLNLIPIPPLDGFGIISPFLDADFRAQMNQVGRYGILVLFIVMWYVPGVNAVFWQLVENIAQRLGIPLMLAYYGLTQFMFWR